MPGTSGRAATCKQRDSRGAIVGWVHAKRSRVLLRWVGEGGRGGGRRGAEGAAEGGDGAAGGRGEGAGHVGPRCDLQTEGQQGSDRSMGEGARWWSRGRVREGHGKWVVAARRNGCAGLRAWGRRVGLGARWGRICCSQAEQARRGGWLQTQGCVWWRPRTMVNDEAARWEQRALAVARSKMCAAPAGGGKARLPLIDIGCWIVSSTRQFSTRFLRARRVQRDDRRP